jgi:hypothetical protein
VLEAAVAKAKSRLDKAWQAGQRFRTAQTVEEYASAWGDYLIALAGVYTALEKGAQLSPKSQPWFGRKKHERKTDPLLKYLHHARDSEEHGLEPILQPANVTFTLAPDGGVEIREASATVGNNKVEFGRQDGLVPPGSSMVSLGLRLVPVHDDRFGDTFYPPDQHLGQPITSIRDLLNMSFRYHEALVREAADLIG